MKWKRSACKIYHNGINLENIPAITTVTNLPTIEAWKDVIQLEQQERLHSEDNPRHLMITHTIESYWIPSQKKTKSKLQI